MKYVARNQIDLPIVQERKEMFKKRLGRTLNFIRQRPERTDSYALLSTVESYAGYLIASSPDAPEICDLLRLMVQSSLAIFKQATATADEVEVSFGNNLQVRLPAKGPNGASGVQSWLKGFYAGVILRDVEALNALAGVPLEVIRHSSTKSDECMYLYVDLLKAIWMRKENLGQRLLDVMAATDPSLLTIADDYVLDIVVPEVLFLNYFLERDREAANQSLVKALEDHKKFWVEDEYTLRPEGYVAWGLLAIATMAYDSELPLEVESEYLPPMLLRGECRA